MVAKLLKDFPDVRDSFEYEDYKQAPTLYTASALISAALDSHMQNLQSENGYLRYIATRPGAEKHGAHCLFGRQENTNLTAAMHDLTAHNGNVDVYKRQNAMTCSSQHRPTRKSCSERQAANHR